MKTMTCRQLGGACDKKFSADTFEEISEMSKQHGMEMFQLADDPHLKAMKEMQEIMKSPQAMLAWMKEKKAIFDSLPEE